MFLYFNYLHRPKSCKLGPNYLETMDMFNNLIQYINLYINNIEIFLITGQWSWFTNAYQTLFLKNDFILVINQNNYSTN